MHAEGGSHHKQLSSDVAINRVADVAAAEALADGHAGDRVPLLAEAPSQQSEASECVFAFIFCVSNFFAVGRRGGRACPTATKCNICYVVRIMREEIRTM